MFDIGLQELIIIFVVALLVFGPKRLPEVGRTLGKWIGELRKGIYDAKMQMESEFEEIQKGTGEEMPKNIAEEDALEKEPDTGKEGGGAPKEEGDVPRGEGDELNERGDAKK
ncbi:MAG: Sec-independent protein translocase protein TatB [Candidatus Sulfobium sp.]|jgi:Tat protein translocase TatB subunit